MQIKDYIKTCKEAKRIIHAKRAKEITSENESNERTVLFIIKEARRIILEIQSEFKKDFNNIDNDEIIRRKAEFSENIKKVENVSKRFQQILQSKFTTRHIDDEITNLTKMYEKLLFNKDMYEIQLKKEVEIRELEKHNLFKEANLNIKLCKFKGYGSDIDIYTFQTDFEKLYSRTTPKHLKPDLLKNNFLQEPALSLVKYVDNIDEIWKRLKMAYGDPKTLLSRKLSQLNNYESLWKIRDPEKIADGLSKVIAVMKDLLQLSKKHSIENKLFNGDALERIFKLLGDFRTTRWLTNICDETFDDEQYWIKLVEFLEKELRVQQQKLLFKTKHEDSKDKSLTGSKSNERGAKRFTAHVISNQNDETNSTCSICGESDHVHTIGPGGMKLVQYFACKRFVNMTPEQRFLELRAKGLCFQCLFPGANSSQGKHKDGKCQYDYVCKHPSHAKYPKKKHVLVCHEHRDSPENQQLLQTYKSRCILRHKSDEIPSFSKDIKLSFHISSASSNYHLSTSNSHKYHEDVIVNKAIYQLQTIKVNNNRFTLFYDSGCGDFVSRFQAIENIGEHASQESKGPINLGGVGGITTQSPHGIYSVNLPLCNGMYATMTGVCLDQITSRFPQYPLQGKVQQDIQNAYFEANGDISNLPVLPKCVGGDIDFMIGIKYLRYHPEFIFQLPSGLTIYKSYFENADGGYGVIGGPHEVFTTIENHFNLSSNHQLTFFSNQYKLFRTGYQINPDLSLLGYKENSFDNDEIENQTSNQTFISKRQRIFNQVEETGTIINYRCVKCRTCKSCKDHDQLEAISIKEEVEQDVINRSVKVDSVNRTTVATLPFMHDPMIKLQPNKHKALSVYNQQLKKLNKNLKDKDDVITSEGKLQSLGHVDYIKNLSRELQFMLKNHPIQNYIPWRAVWKDSSISTPCRVVFDASQVTDSGFSLNDLLAKGRNNMNKLQEIFIRWSTHQVAFHTDVQKMYNSVKLKEEDWCYQRYIWQGELDPSQIPEEKVIKTIIYGVRSSGNQAERGLRETSNLSKDEYPEVNEIISHDVYVDDCLSGEKSHLLATKRADELEVVLNRGGFSLKGISFSGKDPPERLTDDGKSVSVGGMKWFPKDDYLTFDIGDLIFAKKLRGRKPTKDDTVPLQLTRRHCASKVGEVFDLTGKLTPITAAMKIDLHELVQHKLDWDDNIRSLWISHFDMINEIKTLKYRRAVVPADAVNLEINTIDFGDASRQMACAAIDE